MIQHLPDILAFLAVASFLGYTWWPRKTQVVKMPPEVSKELEKKFEAFVEKYRANGDTCRLDRGKTSEVTSEKPLEPTVVITKYNNHKLSEGMAWGANLHLRTQFSPVKPEYKVWIYNVSRLPVNIYHPILKDVKIPGNNTKKRYVMYTSIPQPLMVPEEHIDAAEIIMIPNDARRVAMDLINPDNLGLDQSKSCTERRTGDGRNLGEQGVFWSLHNPPKPAEVVAAVSRMAKHYKDLLELAEVKYQSQIISSEAVTKFMKKEKCSIETAITQLKAEAFRPSPEKHAAADYYKVTTPWHPVSSTNKK